jgi:coenzyme PQQ precursor peptide PqqA
MAAQCAVYHNNFGEEDMSWTTPQFVDMRFGFEITMYIANR